MFHASTSRRIWAALFLGAVVVLTGPAPATGQEPPKDPPTKRKPSDPKAAERENKAQTLFDAALALEKDNKLAEAQTKLRELRSRFRGTWVYLDHMIEISDKITAIGMKLAVAALQKTTMYKRPHQDSWYAYEFAPPDGWKGVPPTAQWFNDYDNSEVEYKGQCIRIARYTAPYLDKLHLQVFKVYAATDVNALETKVVGELEERYKKLKEESKSQQAGRMAYVRKTYTTEEGDRLVIYFYVGERRALALVGTWRSGSEENGWIRITTVIT